MQVQIPDRLFKPDAMPADQRRMAKRGERWTTASNTGLFMRQRGGWSPKMLPKHQRLLNELGRIVHVEVYASRPVG